MYWYIKGLDGELLECIDVLKIGKEDCQIV